MAMPREASSSYLGGARRTNSDGTLNINCHVCGVFIAQMPSNQSFGFVQCAGCHAAASGGTIPEAVHQDNRVVIRSMDGGKVSMICVKEDIRERDPVTNEVVNRVSNIYTNMKAVVSGWGDKIVSKKKEVAALPSKQAGKKLRKGRLFTRGLEEEFNDNRSDSPDGDSQ